MRSCLIYAIGNPGRRDDGLGFEFVKRLPQSAFYDLKHAYQLNIEDSELFAQYRTVLIVDACKFGEQGFSLKQIQAKEDSCFTTHELGMESVLALCQSLYNAQPKTHCLAIKGYEFNLELGLSNEARINLEQACKWFQAKGLRSLN